ncbi:hypothetical protein VTK73DRAFT_9569 [Phialemonium thermophilum]|uniref:Uncharacterized protein n=1 Tax=Phialemonium thermophilum TaxID=223376 RepID=A0ABR3W1P8_9PEZI
MSPSERTLDPARTARTLQPNRGTARVGLRVRLVTSVVQGTSHLAPRPRRLSLFTTRLPPYLYPEESRCKAGQPHEWDRKSPTRTNRKQNRCPGNRIGENQRPCHVTSARGGGEWGRKQRRRRLLVDVLRHGLPLPL